MNKYSSDSDESIEHMKLDLLKAKYIHQKLKKPTTYSNTKKSTKEIKPIKGNSNPTFAIQRRANQNESVHKHRKDDSKMEEYSEDSHNCSEDENEDIVSMNNYVDYLLDKRREVANEELKSNPSSSVLSLHHFIASSQDPATIAADGYRNDNDDYSSAFNPSTDILAQWRLRRKLSEAKHSVQSEHQKHNLRINSLHMDQIDTTNYLYPQLMKSESLNSCAEYDKIPVHDTPAKVPVAKCDSCCQCNIDSIIGKQEVSRDERPKDAPTKSRHQRKMKRTVGVSTNCAPKNDASTMTEVCTRSFNRDINAREPMDWDHQSGDHDYIDIAIQKTLQSQLFDRNCSSAMSTITSINDSQRDQNNSQLEIVEHSAKDVDNRLNNADKTVPWNSQFEIESGEEFIDDDVLIDLRKRRIMNLHRLRSLSLKIQNQTGSLPSVELL